MKVLTADGLTPQSRCTDPETFYLLMVSHLKTRAETLKFRTADGLTPPKRC